MEMSGLLHKITADWVNNTGSDAVNEEFHSLGYQDTLFPFLIISGGCLFVFGLILIETIIKRPRSNTNSAALGTAWINRYCSLYDFEFTQWLSCTLTYTLLTFIFFRKVIPGATMKPPQGTK